MRPFRELPEVTAWEASFSETRFRYNFLVLDGPSKMGKTLFCRSRSLGGGEMLELDCAGADTPDLTKFQFGKHTMVLCDEASASMVLRYKKLFQASASFCVLGSSKTNCHAYEVWPHAVKFVVTSNRWRAELEKMPQEDSGWLMDNSVYVYVDRPLWLQTAWACPWSRSPTAERRERRCEEGAAPAAGRHRRARAPFFTATTGYRSVALRIRFRGCMQQ